MKGLLVTVGFFGLCFGRPNNIEVMPSSGGLPPVQSGIPSGSNVEAMPTNAGSMTRPSWPGSYQPGAPIYGNQYPSSGQTFQPYSSSGGCSSGGCSSGGSTGYPSMNTYPSSGQGYPSYPSGGCSSGGCSSGSSYPAPQPVYGGSSSYNPGWSTGGSSGFNPGFSTGGSGYNPGLTGGPSYISTLPGSISNSGMSAPVYRPCSSSSGGGCGSQSGSGGCSSGGCSSGSSYPAPRPAYGGCGSSSASYGTMMGSMMPSCSNNRRPSYSRRAGRFGSWGSKQQFTKPMPAISSGLPSMSSGMPSMSSVSSSSSSSGCGSCGK